MRRLFGWLLIVLGLLAVLGGAAVAAAFGSDDTVRLGPHRLTTTGSAIVTAPRVISYAGPTLTVTATSPNARTPVFIGYGHDVDVRDYLARTAYTRIDSISLPWQVKSSTVAGREGSPASPRGLSWWLTTAVARGRTSATLPLPNAPIDIVVMDLGQGRPADGFSVDVRVGILVPGSFAGGLAVALGGGGLIAAGWAVRRAVVAGRRVGVARRAAV